MEILTFAIRLLIHVEPQLKSRGRMNGIDSRKPSNGGMHAFQNSSHFPISSASNLWLIYFGSGGFCAMKTEGKKTLVRGLLLMAAMTVVTLALLVNSGQGSSRADLSWRIIRASPRNTPEDLPRKSLCRSLKERWCSFQSTAHLRLELEFGSRDTSFSMSMELCVWTTHPTFWARRPDCT
jgi:hypothetical protein